MNTRRLILPLAITAVTIFAVAIWTRGAGERPRVGSCTVHEPGAPSHPGASAYAEHVTPTVRGTTGSLAITIVCETEGPAADLVTLILPNLQRGETPAPGHYRIRSPMDSLTQGERLDPRLAWARVARGDGSMLFPALGGSVRLVTVRTGVIEGAYQVAIGPADSALALPGAQSEGGGRFRIDSAGLTIISPTVLGGAFVATRREVDWRGR